MNGMRGVRLGRIFGIDIAFDYSWLFIVVLMTWSLAVSFAHWHPTWSGPLAFFTALVATLLFFGSVLLHELAHSIVARRFGVPVHRITLFLFGGVSNIEREPPSPKAEFWTAVVGPLMSIALGILFLFLGSLASGVASDAVLEPASRLARLTPMQTLLVWLGPINILVGVFNLIPGFPLDGGRILRSVIWGISHDLHTATRWASAVGQAIGWIFVFLGVAMAFGANVPFFGRGLIAGMWLAFIGWFLSSAAAQTWRQQLVHEILAGVTVSRLMRTPAPAVLPEVDVATFVHDWLMRRDERAYPVTNAAGDLLGLVTMADLRPVPRDAWPSVRVSQIMSPRERLVTSSPRDEAAEALDKLMRANVSQLPVLDGGRLVGMLLRNDVARWIELHVQTPARGYAH
jgi:Zn-dependent protease/CBS domain-containing protein